MKTKQLLTKMLLVAVGMLAGSNAAWGDAGDVTTNVNLTFAGSAPFAANNGCDYTKGTGETLKSATAWSWNDGGNPKSLGMAISDGRLQMSNGNLSVIFDGDAAGSKDIVAIDFDLAYTYLYNSNNNREIKFQVYAGSTAVVTESYNFNKNTISSTTMGLTTDYIYSAAQETDWAKKVHFKLTFNYYTKKITMTTACSSATEKTGNFNIDMPDGMGALTSFYIGIGSSAASSGRYALFDDLVVTTTEGDYSTAKTITYAYQDQVGNDITAVVTANGGLTSATPDVSTTYTPEYPASFTDAEWAYDYTYVSGGDAFTVTGDATITLVYNKTDHPTTNVTVNYKNGGTTIKSDAIAADYPTGKAIEYNLRKYVLDDEADVLYQTASAMGTKRNLAAAATIDEALTTTGIENVVFFAEGEEIDTKSGTGSSSIASRQSMGRFNSDSKITSLAAGKYHFYAMTHCGNGTDGNVNGIMTVKAGENTIGSKNIMARTNNQVLEFDFIIAETSDILVNYAGGNSSGVDYIYIKYLGDAIYSATVSSAGWATLYTPYALDFSDVDGLTAYTAACDGSTVTLTEVTNVPANTGVVLKGAENTYSIPVIASSSTEKGDLKGSATEATACPATSGTYYILTMNGANAEFNPATSGEIAAGKAYLHVGGSSRSLSIVFNDATGISSMQHECTLQNEVYNLNGQRVAQPRKGLYIVNGKKTVIR